MNTTQPTTDLMNADTPDYLLLPVQLDEKYNPDGDGEHPQITRAMWRTAVEQQETISGYWDWLYHKLIEQAESNS